MRIAFLLYLITGLFLSSHSFAQNESPLTFHNEDELLSGREKIKIESRDLLEKARASGRNLSLHVDLPIAGNMIGFEAVQNDVLEDAQGKFDLFTYDLKAHGEENYKGVLTVSDHGIYAILLAGGKLINIYPENAGKTGFHIVEYGVMPEQRLPAQFCGHDHGGQAVNHHAENKIPRGLRSNFTIGSKRYNYRVAIVVTGEFYINNGNADSPVRAAVVSTVNAISAIFNNEMSFRLTVGSRVNLTYKDPATDIFIPGGPVRTIQAGNAVAMHFGAGLYDVGHVFHQHADGDGWENGGLAQLNSVCNNSDASIVKARGWSGSYSNVGNAWINLAAHEFGHQFGANHTFNGTGESCTGAISGANAYEIGSGTTIMSYNGICEASQNIPGGGEIDNYFHIQSVLEMFNYVYNGPGGSCGSPVDAPNPAPQVDANPCNTTLTIPKGTPFFLKAKGEWTDTDSHTFSWEQTDEDGAGTPTQGKIGNAAATDPRAPLFRSFPPTASPVRYFPNLNTLQSGVADPFEVLPLVARTMNFQVSLRDNNATGGILTTDAVTVTVSNQGPFVITGPTSGSTLQAGTQANITWNTNGSNSLCNKVRIRLSRDGGRTFPIIIAENVNYSGGVFNYNIPVNFLKTTTARLMVECMDAECAAFFNVSSGNFTINSNCLADNSALCSTAFISADEGSSALNLNMSKVIGDQIFTVSKTVNSGNTFNKVGVRGVDGIGCVEQQVRNTRTNLYVVETGTYQFSFQGTGWASLHRANYNPNNPCSSFVTSTATQAVTGGLFFGNGFSADLQACTEYVLIFFTFEQFVPANLSLTLTSGPGLIIEKKNISPNYQNVYLLVDNATGVIKAAGQSTDYTNISAGTYTLTSVVLDAAFDASSLPGQLYTLISNTVCLNTGYNSKTIEIKAACRISDVAAGIQGACVPGTNTFTQEIIVTHDKAPGSGKLSVNGQLFDILPTPQTVLITNLDSDGTPRNVSAFFTTSINCKLDKNNVFTAPPNCCPLNFDLGADKMLCAGDVFQLNAGDNGVSYVWKKSGAVISGANQKILDVTEPGMYEVEVTHSSGCKKSDKIEIVFNPNPVVSLETSASFCTGSSVLVNGAVTGGQTLSWFKNGTLITGANSATLEVNAAGVYRLEATSNTGCRGRDSILVSESAIPLPSLGADIEKCQGTEVSLDAGTNGKQFTWFKNNVEISGETGRTYKPQSSGTYKVVVVNDANCSGTDEINVTINPLPVISNLNNKLEGCRDKTLVISPNINGFATITWFFNNSPITGANAPTFTIPLNQSGIYAVEALSSKGCAEKKSIEVVFRDNPVVDLGNNELTSCIGSSVELDAGGDGKTYQWTKDNVALTETGRKLTISSAGNYAVTVTNEFNCSSTDQIKIDFVSGPTVSLNGDKTLCEGEQHTITLTTNATNPVISWFKDNVLIAGQSGLSLQVNASGTYELVLKGGMPACEVRKSVNIKVNPLPAFDLGGDRVLCEGAALPVLDGGAANTGFEWLRNNVPIATSRTITANVSGTYSLTATNSFGCKRTASVQVTINPLPQLTLPANFDLCEGTVLKIMPVSDAVRYEWKKDNVLINGATGNSLDINTPGSYAVNVFSAESCTRTQTFNVMLRSKPLLNLGRDTVLCPGTKLLLDGGIHSTYKWTDNSTGKTLEVDAGLPDVKRSITVGLTVTSNFNCNNSDEIKIELLPVVKASVISDKPGICDDEPVKITASGGLKYSWNDPDGNTLSSLSESVTFATPIKTTLYTVTVSDGICPGNQEVKTIEIKKFEPVNVSAGQDTCVIVGRSVRLLASGGVKYSWDNTDVIEGSSTIFNPVVKPEVETVFTVTITDSNGCVYLDSVKVCIKEDSFRPVSIISPNGDGKNDALYFGGLADFPDNTLRIFNRWGNLIFEATGYQTRGNLFEGMRGGERLPADTYYYILTYDNNVIKSSLTIIWD